MLDGAPRQDSAPRERVERAVGREQQASTFTSLVRLGGKAIRKHRRALKVAVAFLRDRTRDTKRATTMDHIRRFLRDAVQLIQCKLVDPARALTPEFSDGLSIERSSTGKQKPTIPAGRSTRNRSRIQADKAFAEW